MLYDSTRLLFEGFGARNSMRRLLLVRGEVEVLSGLGFIGLYRGLGTVRTPNGSGLGASGFN